METDSVLRDSCEDYHEDTNISVNAGLIHPHNIDRSILIESETNETSQPDEVLSTSVIGHEQETVTFEVFPEGSKRGKPLLVSSDGFRYSVKKNQKKSVLWICSSRSLKVRCYATVIQKGSEFVRGHTSHQHGPKVSLKEKISVSVQVKTSASANPYKSATEISTEIRDNSILPEQPGLPLASSLARKANRYRCTLRPAEPKDLQFEVDECFLKCKDFLVADITNGSARHLVFATKQQLELLSNTKRWFMDGTFKVVGQPFESGQLSSIHGFVKVNNVEKQVPLA
ncbi:uncharacterized protein LOC132732364 [Ruditapes philippinarum]|uniref:uncharacterized protein LOC132732364 n=1 Tax=Ruditapes philippinarum TaxID=129788 RepID=UPI00295AA0BB|nr:uncharacterized protein LOC132732364 [Ruditapes philippinarum]